MPAPQKIIDLVQTFERKREELKAGKYNETQVRQEFIDPFFKALGWDIDNEKGKAEAYKDVVHEDSIKIGDCSKAPDYCFRVGGTRKFFVEAKKPSVDLKESSEPAFQVRRYAWSAKLPLSILTDFEEFVVYDCRIKPLKTDGSAKARIRYFTYKDYVEQWDTIASIFSLQAIEQGSFDAFAEQSKQKRGTQEVDDAFLEEIERWRELLAKNIALRNPSLSQRELNYAVQQTIDRIVFLRICEDRGIEPYGQLQGEVNGARIYERLKEHFRNADARYNSGLFHFRDEKDQSEAPDTISPALAIDDIPLKDIINNLYYPDCPYAFSVFSSDILGQVYERFLGKVIRLTEGHHAKVEEKPEVRKAGGVYYTPKYIVDYIVEHTVGKLLEGKTPKEVEKLKIVDPACGSGSFLLGAYQQLLDWHLTYYTENDPTKWKKELIRIRRHGEPAESMMDFRLTTAERKKILLNNIFGVDIDAQAVEVTKLSLLLKVLEGESDETIGKQMSFLKERVLPDLGSNIKCGNSLIGPDFYAQPTLLDQIERRLGELVEPRRLDDDERYRINVFDWESAFPEVFKRKNPGFDAVIGNPPYVVVGKDEFVEAVVRYLHQYRVAQYKMDLFHLFIQKGVDLLNKEGKLGYIVPNTWLTLQFTEQLRRFLLEITHLDELVLFENRVFEDADVHTVLLFLNRQKSNIKQIAIKHVREAHSVLDIEKERTEMIDLTEWENTEGAVFETRMTGENGEIAKAIMKKWPPLSTIARISLGCQAYNSSKHTKEQIESRVFHAETKLSEEYLPELAGNDVGRYLLERKRGKWIKYGSWLHDYRPIDWLQGPRILVREITGAPPHRIQACYEERTYCNYKTILNINPSDQTKISIKYLLGILNSKLMSFLYPFYSNKIVAQTFPRLSVGDLKKLPIRNLDLTSTSERKLHDRVVDLVDQMLSLHKQAPKTPPEQESLKRQIEAIDKQIDLLVYELYGLSESEVNLIESYNEISN